MSKISIRPESFGEAFRSEQFEAIYSQTSQAFQQLVSLQDFVSLSKSFNESVAQYNLENKTFVQRMDNFVWTDDQKEKAINVTFDQDQVIQSLLLKPFITYPECDAVFTKNKYIMPVKGEWFVFWGGTNEFINYHYAHANQRYAYDLEKVRDGLSYHDSPTDNENYYAFGGEIVAPADGKVVQVVDGLKDSVPGEMDAENLAGNYVVIEHAHQEYSLLAHLKKNSVNVKVGDDVKAGQSIGTCGNSGNSSEPHLHFHIMDAADFGTGKSIRIQFKDGNEPIQGDTVITE
ncbi:M23 family metallopeptidase [Terribacillus saccharophilus]|uniref:M23 family metallopeptidase n=1 Tax=Terribacillus saccharophilus TaxID=361277 RepID=UPI0039829713